MEEISLKGFEIYRKKKKRKERSLAMSTKSILFLPFFLRETYWKYGERADINFVTDLVSR